MPMPSVRRRSTRLRGVAIAALLAPLAIAPGAGAAPPAPTLDSYCSIDGATAVSWSGIRPDGLRLTFVRSDGTSDVFVAALARRSMSYAINTPGDSADNPARSYSFELTRRGTAITSGGGTCT